MFEERRVAWRVVCEESTDNVLSEYILILIIHLERFIMCTITYYKVPIYVYGIVNLIILFRDSNFQFWATSLAGNLWTHVNSFRKKLLSIITASYYTVEHTCLIFKEEEKWFFFRKKNAKILLKIKAKEDQLNKSKFQTTLFDKVV